MNIFYVDKSPTAAARALCNKHVVKMILETAQLLSTAHHVNKNPNLDYTYLNKFLLKRTHENHPCAIWCRSAQSNYMWLVKHGLALCKEYTYRYKKIHKLQCLMYILYDNLPVFSRKKCTEPPQCMPEQFKVIGNPVRAYRNYYTIDKRTNIKCEWKIRLPPSWWN